MGIRLRVAALVVAMGAVGLSPARAQVTYGDGWKNWDMICGGNESYAGNVLNLCASVHLSIGAADASGESLVTLQVWNYAELAGSTPSGLESAVFTKIAFFNTQGEDIGVIVGPDGRADMTGEGYGNPEEWLAGVAKDVSFNSSGGVKVEFGATTDEGVNDGIASGCVDPSVIGITSYWHGGCVGDGVSIAFRITNADTWNLETTGLSVHAQNLGPARAYSTTCIAGGDKENCSATVVPEPTTVVLLATGLLGLGGVAWRRRREGFEIEMED